MWLVGNQVEYNVPSTVNRIFVTVVQGIDGVTYLDALGMISLSHLAKSFGATRVAFFEGVLIGMPWFRNVLQVAAEGVGLAGNMIEIKVSEEKREQALQEQKKLAELKEVIDETHLLFLKNKALQLRKNNQIREGEKLEKLAERVQLGISPKEKKSYLRYLKRLMRSSLARQKNESFVKKASLLAVGCKIARLILVIVSLALMMFPPIQGVTLTIGIIGLVSLSLTGVEATYPRFLPFRRIKEPLIPQIA